MDLTQDQRTLLEATTKDLIQNVARNLDLLYARQAAFGHFISETGDTLQIQITVVRDETEFLDFLQTEECTSF